MIVILGGYISQDPIGLEGNNPNFYAYVWDSNSWMDPYGLLVEGKQGDLGKHGDLKNVPGGGQSHHLNQDAAFRDVIPTNKGAAIKLEGNAFKDINSPHYKAHQRLEEFWDQYRKGGNLFGQKPTNLQYTLALKRSLCRAGLNPQQINNALKSAIRNRVDYGFLGGQSVPRIPGRINQAKP